MESIAYLILSGKYIGYLPSHYAQGWVARQKMREIEPNRYRYTSHHEFITCRGLRPNLVVATFLSALRESHRRVSA